MKRQKSVKVSRYTFFLPLFLAAAGPVAKSGSIQGTADPKAQIVTMGLDSGTVIGTTASCKGTYIVDALKPGRYSIVEGGPGHAIRMLSVQPDRISHVDLAPEAKSACS